MSATVPAALPVDTATERQLARGEQKSARGVANRSKRRLTSRGATIAALIIAVIWTTRVARIFSPAFRSISKLTARVADGLSDWLA